jgi:hypothetical protein
MAYFIDLSKISLEVYKEKLKTAYLSPGRMILKENIDKRFSLLKEAGAGTVRDLLIILRSKKKFAELAKQRELPSEYLIILLRELNSIHPKPNKIRDFPGLSEDTIENLEAKGLTNTVKLYDRVLTAESRKVLSQETGIAQDIITEVAKLSDISRVKWAGVTFARMLYHLGYDSVEKISRANPVDMHQQINRLNLEKGFYKGSIGLNDIRIFIAAAADVPQEISFDEIKISL